tara:strand:- start:16867 stop:17466 length:600 start_codon:yes stop_codon:yes gene_type:complete
MKNKIFYTLTFALIFIFSSATAQDITLTLTDVQQFKIDGDSNVRSWDADITEAEGTLIFTEVEEFSLGSLSSDSFQSMNISIPVSGIESSSGGLTRNMQKYLKGDEHPVITFNLSEITAVELDENKATITANGVINAAGVDHNVTMNVNAVVNENGSVTFSGSQDLLMTNFNIDPPTAVMGTIRARDEIVILYSVTFYR